MEGGRLAIMLPGRGRSVLAGLQANGAAQVPINGKIRICGIDRTLAFGGVVGVGFISHMRDLRENCKAVSKAFGNVHLQIVFVGEFGYNILSEGGGTRSNIQRYIQNATAYRTHEFGLSVFALLKMQSS